MTGNLDRRWMQEWREQVFQNAGYKCECCGKPASEAHHISGRQYKSLKFEVRNGAALCQFCHARHHGQTSNPVTLALMQKRPADMAFIERMKRAIKTTGKYSEKNLDADSVW